MMADDLSSTPSHNGHSDASLLSPSSPPARQPSSLSVVLRAMPWGVGGDTGMIDESRLAALRAEFDMPADEVRGSQGGLETFIDAKG